MKNCGIAEAQFWQSASVGPLILLSCWSAIISVVHCAADQQTSKPKNSDLPTSALYITKEYFFASFIASDNCFNASTCSISGIQYYKKNPMHVVPYPTIQYFLMQFSLILSFLRNLCSHLKKNLPRRPARRFFNRDSLEVS